MAHQNLPPLPDDDWPKFAPGWVWLVGAGPGDPGLITLHALNALRQADHVVYDALVDSRILQWVKPGAEIEYAGKRGGKPSPKQRDISLRLVELARAGKRVLRLKGGDPFVFGRGGEEALTLINAGIPIRIVPGISAGIGGAARPAPPRARSGPPPAAPRRPRDPATARTATPSPRRRRRGRTLS